jgi:ATP-binding cassette, subfamily B, bacterial PglK
MNPRPSPNAVKNLLVRFWSHLGRRRRRQFVLLVGLMALSAFADVVSIGSVVPFLGILLAPNRVFGYPVAARLAREWHITSAAQLVLPLTVAFVAAAVTSGAIRTLLLWCITRFSHGSGAELSAEVYRRTLYQPYHVHVARNSSQVLSIITVKVLESVNVLYMLLVLISSLLSVLLITAALIFIDPVAASLAAAVFGSAYVLVIRLYRRRLHDNSRRIATEQTQIVKAIQEGLGGIRDVLLDGTQSAYFDIYRRADLPLRRAQGNNLFITQAPRYAMETVGMVLIAGLAYGLSHQAGGVASALPVLGTLALGAQRLLPTLQVAYGSWTSMLACEESLSDTLAMLDQPVPPEVLSPAPPPLPFRDVVSLVGVRFRYDSHGPWVLNGIELSIRRGTRVGVVGTTGSGKSTLLDLLMGLLTPTAGEVLVDGQPVTRERVRAWQRTIAHVPQSIFLADTTLAENIAFGVPRADIDLQRVQGAARQAQIAEFIEGREQGYETTVGERGIRLSGGQRQRIGIARALYKQASVLVFDEATSALDSATESSVMDAIEGLHRDLTIVLIAHRLTTVRRCDIILELERGRIVAQGTYEQLMQSSPSFQRMARAAV